jgi:queuine tRNA-ribosyltransferase
MILSWVNTVFYQELMAAMREAIAAGRFDDWAAEAKARITAPPAAP